jgi:hypothetical protein
MRVLAKKHFAPLTQREAVDYVGAVYMQVQEALGIHDKKIFVDEDLNGVFGGIGYFYYLTANPMTRFALADKRVLRIIEQANLQGDPLDFEAIAARLKRVRKCIQEIISDLNRDPHPNPTVQTMRDFKRQQQSEHSELPVAGEITQ